MKTQSWFEVSTQGLAKLVERRGKQYAILEPIQNALDEAKSSVRIHLKPVAGEARVALEVEDDNPEGFKFLEHAYTLFAQSTKGADPEKRGRFNMGEKLFLSLCEEAVVDTTKGQIHFHPSGRETFPRRKRPSGSQITAWVKLNRVELGLSMALIRSLIVPTNLKVTLNDEPLVRPALLKQFEASLATEFTDDDTGVLHRSKRNTPVNIYEPKRGEVPMLYELGIPVVETGDRWHYDVRQRVPLNMERDNVTPGYLRELRTRVLNVMQDEISAEDANASWVRDSLSDPNVAPEAVNVTLDKLFGAQRVSFDPSDPEANKLAAINGYTVVPGGSFSKEQWQNIRRAGAIKPAGQVTPSMEGQMGSEAAKEAIDHGKVLLAIEILDRWIMTGDLSDKEIRKMRTYIESWQRMLEAKAL